MAPGTWSSWWDSWMLVLYLVSSFYSVWDLAPRKAHDLMTTVGLPYQLPLLGNTSEVCCTHDSMANHVDNRDQWPQLYHSISRSPATWKNHSSVLLIPLIVISFSKPFTILHKIEKLLGELHKTFVTVLMNPLFNFMKINDFLPWLLHPAKLIPEFIYLNLLQWLWLRVIFILG